MCVSKTKTIRLKLKHFGVQVLLALLRGLVLVKRHSAPLLRMIGHPLRATARVLIRVFGVPGYRVVFFFRRYFSTVYIPARKRLLYLASNRYAIHLLFIILAVGVGVLNISTRGVRAETFGQQSLLYALVAQNDLDVVETVRRREDVSLAQSVQYLSDTIVSDHSHMDAHGFADAYVSTDVGSTESLASQSVREAVPARNEVETHIVESGDTLGGIAETYGLNLSTILWANNLTLRSTLQLGQKITILPKDGVMHTVKNGETISQIARKYSVEGRDIVSANALASADALKVGQSLLVPGGEPAAASAPARTASVAQLFTAPTPRPSVSSTSPSTGSWVWPTDWRVITQYYGWRHTGLDIDGDYSTNSYAAHSGVVVYSGWRFGYGLTVEIDHGNGIMTRYAHHSRNYVAVGEQVVTGQAIAQTGTTGRSTGTHLHFEIIKNGRFQNPLDWVR